MTTIQIPNDLKPLWAKKEIENHNLLWLPLVAHLTDTSNVITFLYTNWLNHAQRQIIQTNLSYQQAIQLVKFLGFFHDFGKATPAFQTKKSYQNSQILDTTLINKLIHHGFLDLDKFDPDLDIRQKTPHGIAGETILTSNGLDPSIGAIIGGHHGKPVDNNLIIKHQLSTYTSNFYQVDSTNSKIAKHWHQIYQDLIKFGLSICHFNSLQEVPHITESQSVFLEGLLIMSDWLASSEYLDQTRQQKLFNLIPINKTIDSLNFNQRFEHAISTWQKTNSWHPQKVNSISKLFYQRFGFKPNSIQKRMLADIQTIQDPGLIIIEAPCGSGKTETALSATEILSYQTRHNGLFIGLPTQATSNAMFDRVENWLESIAQNSHANLSLKLIHGKSLLNQTAQSLPNANNINNNQGTVAVNSWFTGRKSILVKFDVATIDNLLAMSLENKALFLKHLGLSGKIVIIDEIHAYDAYMDEYLKKCLKWLGQYHIPVIALSATLPNQKRQEFFKAYARGKFHHRINTKSLQTNQYPSISWLDNQEIHQDSNFNNIPQKHIKITRLDNTDQTLIKKVHKIINSGGIVGIVVNTVKKAQRISQELDDLPTILIHSAYLAPQRQQIENHLQKLIGKQGKRPKKLVVIGTQVLSQSLDIDFDVLFTDMAPIDSLIQRIGRMHRHNITRPKNLKQPHVYLLDANDYNNYDPGTSAIYSQYILQKTDWFLPKNNKLTLPKDTPRLIEKVYNPKTNLLVPDVDQNFQDFQAQIKKHQQKAHVFQIGNPNQLPNLHGLLQENLNINAEEARATVRDIQPTIEVIMLKEINQQYYTIENNTNIKNLSPKQLSQETIRLPHSWTYNIAKVSDALDANTKKLFPKWQNSVWLKYSKVIVLGQDNLGQVNKIKFKYDHKLGLTKIENE